uniref:Transcription elongation factor A like 8 n=1 Tax=Bos taurus TaxID=9913 RepID=A0AAA9TA11_BOVIN
MRTWGNFRGTRPRIVQGTRDSGTDLLTKQSCRSAGLLVFGERPKSTEGRGRKIPWIPAGLIYSKRKSKNTQPSEEGVSQEAEGNLRGGLTQPGQGYKEDSPVRHLDPEEMIRGADELERLREEIRRVRNKFVMMHWKQRHSRSRPYPVCFRP